MLKFRKKPVVIEAVQFDGTDASYNDVCALAPGVHFEPIADRRFKVPTLEGEHVASPGDWIIRGVKGELYPCKPDIFAMTYDSADRSTATTIAAGDTVRLKSGGPVMTAISVMAAGAVECAWFMASSALSAAHAGLAYLQGQASTQTFPAVALEKVEPPRTTEPAA